MTDETTTTYLGAYEARLLRGILGNALDQDHDDVAGDYFWFLLDDDQMEKADSPDEADVEETREAYARIREVLASADAKLAAIATDDPTPL